MRCEWYIYCCVAWHIFCGLLLLLSSLCCVVLLFILYNIVGLLLYSVLVVWWVVWCILFCARLRVVCYRVVLHIWCIVMPVWRRKWYLYLRFHIWVSRPKLSACLLSICDDVTRIVHWQQPFMPTSFMPVPQQQWTNTYQPPVCTA